MLNPPRNVAHFGNKTMTIRNLVIIGSGPAGCTAAIYSARANLQPIMLVGNNAGGQLTQANTIENWPGEELISGFELMEKMQGHARSLGAEILSEEAVAVDFSFRPFRITTTSGSVIETRTIIIATGASPRLLGLPSEQEFRGRGVSTCATCDGFFYRNQDVAVIGGGNTALQDVLYLANICRHVYLVHRRETFRAEQLVVERLQQEVKKGTVELVLDSTIKEIKGTPDQGVTAIEVRHKDGTTRTIDVTGVFVAVGHVPNSSLFAPLALKQDGTIKTGLQPHYKTSCSIAGVFAAGDVADDVYRQAITSAATGCQAALDAERFLKMNG